MSSPNTPMLRQYHEIRKQYPGTLLFFRLGDFYEMFYEDAEIGARELSITLTARHKETDNPVPMCGVPHHALKHYLSRLIKKGYRVALCEQVEEASAAVKLVKRKVVRVITPGTAIDEQLLEGADNQYLAAVFGAGDHMAAAFLDLSTGEFQATEFAGPDHFTNTLLQLEQFNPREILCSRSLEPLFAPHIAPRSVENLPTTTEDEESADQRLRLSTVLTLLDDWSFAPEQGADFLTQHFEVTTLDGFGLSDKKWAIGASAAIVRYVRDTQMCDAKHITELSYFEPQEYMQLDAATVRNLELVEAIQGGKRETLFGTIDLTQTGMGARLLKSWLLRPSLKLGELNARLDAVGELHRQTMNRDKLRQWLTQVYDVERLLGRVSLGTANPRDLVALGSSLEPLPAMKQLLGTMKSSLLQVLYESLDELTDVRSWIGEALTESPPMKIDEGNVIRVGFHAELDSLRELRSNTQSFIAEVERRERERTGIASLKVKSNNVFGYFIEVTKSNLKNVPADYQRKQTIATGERFITPELKDYEEKILSAEQNILQLETTLFTELKQRIAAQIGRIQITARILATLDVLGSFAQLAAMRNYVRPELHEDDELTILNGRHPVVETHTTRFVPNDVHLNNTTDRLVIITGPNMGGKSVYLRQTALIVILAQIGCFVPASQARLPLLDRVFTRVGASDNLARGRSTFMVEMTEAANILNTATPRSLVLLDEIGRGTATFDGLSLAWAIAEHLHNSPQHAAKTLFATHYHEMVELEKLLPGVHNVQLAVTAKDGHLIFLHKVVQGSASKSYGIEVAKLAGLPAVVLSRAREILENLEANELDVLGKPKLARHMPSRKDWKKNQPTLFDKANESVIDDLRALDAEHLTPEEAKKALIALQSQLV
ncbi:MAG TPA: DNA mismatch repair protein MutS [Acidobacteriota bacterium]|nr:DNA mismatch repair protein MutS [Acidobacteriota bacterium]